MITTLVVFAVTFVWWVRRSWRSLRHDERRYYVRERPHYERLPQPETVDWDVVVKQLLDAGEK